MLENGCSFDEMWAWPKNFVHYNRTPLQEILHPLLNYCYADSVERKWQQPCGGGGVLNYPHATPKNIIHIKLIECSEVGCMTIATERLL